MNEMTMKKEQVSIGILFLTIVAFLHNRYFRSLLFPFPMVNFSHIWFHSHLPF